MFPLKYDKYYTRANDQKQKAHRSVHSKTTCMILSHTKNRTVLFRAEKVTYAIK